MPETGSRSGYDSTAEKAQGVSKKVAGKLSDDEVMEQEGTVQEALAAEEEKRILEPTERQKSAEEMRDNPDR
ncbi:MAG: hypothetical protein M3357_11485 [Actinomycetota bacterium]|nr:hypothetical protein [Actinomycetota bacterium]